MIIMLEGTLPCAELEDQPAGLVRLCRQAANVGIITPMGDGVWELLPVCQGHFQAAHDWSARDGHPLQSWIHAHGPPAQVGS